MYCGHCAPCSQKIDIAAVNKYLDLALIQEVIPETLRIITPYWCITPESALSAGHA